MNVAIAAGSLATFASTSTAPSCSTTHTLVHFIRDVEADMLRHGCSLSPT
jgi:hypothetical protein